MTGAGSRRKVEAILFDLDDTLRDWRLAIDGAVDALIAETHPDSRQAARARLWEAIEHHCVVWRGGMVMDRAYWKLLYESGTVIAEAFPGLAGQAEALSETFRSRLRPPLFRDTVPALAALQGVCRLGILSNNPRAQDAVEMLGLSGYFSAVVGLPPERGKPRKEAFEEGCAALKASPGACAYVGDSYENDVLGAAEAGLYSIWLDREGLSYPIPHGAERIQSLEEVCTLLATPEGDSPRKGSR